MTRITKRTIERALRLPAPAPSADLGRRIKDQIPDDLFGAATEESRRDHASGAPVERGAAPPKPLGRPAVWAVAASLAVAIGAGWLAARRFDSVDARSERRASVTDPASAPAAVVETRERADAEVAQPASPPAAAAPIARRMEAARDLESASTGLATAKQALAKADTDSDRVHRLVGDLLEVAADRSGSRSPSSTMSIEGTSARDPGRIVLLVSAMVRDGAATAGRTRAADSIELELDPALVSRHRLLARRASGPGVDRVIALYELEVPGDLDRTAVLGAVRLPGDGTAADGPAARSIVAADVSSDWARAAVSLRLAALGAEVALLPADASPEVEAGLRAELERLRAGFDVDPDSARRASELLDVLSR